MNQGPRSLEDALSLSKCFTLLTVEQSEVIKDIAFKRGVAILCSQENDDTTQTEKKALAQQFALTYQVELTDTLLKWLEVKHEPLLIVDSVKNAVMTTLMSKTLLLSSDLQSERARNERSKLLISKHEAFEQDFIQRLTALSLECDECDGSVIEQEVAQNSLYVLKKN